MSRCYCGAGYTCGRCGAAGGRAEGFYATDRTAPKPIADEVVELGTLRGGERFEFHESRSWHCGDGWDECQLTVIGPSQDGDGSVTCERADGAQTDFMPYRKVRRVPAPTPAKRPPCDACGEESCPSPSMGLDTHGGCRFCSKCWHLPHADNMERVRSRRAKQTSGSETPKCAPSNPQLVDRPLSEPEATNRWQTRDPARIAALEAKLAKQVASGGQGGKSARWLLERADRLRREAENQPTERLHPDKRRALVVGTCVYLPTGKVEPGPRLMRHELPSDQRLDRKLTGR